MVVAQLQGDRGARDRTDVELALSADVEELHPERGGGRQAREDDRRRENVGGSDGAARPEAGVEEPAVRRAWVVARPGEHDRHERERDDERAEGNGHVEPLRPLQPALDPHSRPPAIR
jgi:hypothetical protein